MNIARNAPGMIGTALVFLFLDPLTTFSPENKRVKGHPFTRVGMRYVMIRYGVIAPDASIE
jgi:hypothetical protein